MKTVWIERRKKKKEIMNPPEKKKWIHKPSEHTDQEIEKFEERFKKVGGKKTSFWKKKRLQKLREKKIQEKKIPSHINLSEKTKVILRKRGCE